MTYGLYEDGRKKHLGEYTPGNKSKDRQRLMSDAMSDIREDFSMPRHYAALVAFSESGRPDDIKLQECVIEEDLKKVPEEIGHLALLEASLRAVATRLDLKHVAVLDMYSTGPRYWTEGGKQRRKERRYGARGHLDSCRLLGGVVFADNSLSVEVRNPRPYDTSNLLRMTTRHNKRVDAPDYPLVIDMPGTQWDGSVKRVVKTGIGLYVPIEVGTTHRNLTREVVAPPGIAQ